MCQPLLSPVAPIRAPEWERLWITHLYPLKASEAGGEEEEKEGERRGGGVVAGKPLANMCRWVSALTCDTDKSRCHSHFQPAVTLRRCSHAFRAQR